MCVYVTSKLAKVSPLNSLSKYSSLGQHMTNLLNKYCLPSIPKKEDIG